MTRARYDEIWHDPRRTRAFVAKLAGTAPELFPPGFGRGYRLHGFGGESRKLAGMKLRKLVMDDGSSYWLRPGFIAGYMAGAADELAYSLLLAAHGVPAWLLAIGFGHSEMCWHLLVERLGRGSLMRTAVRDPSRLPEHLAADEHHADRAGAKGYLAATFGGGCILGVALSPAADDDHLRRAYGVFAAEARNVGPGYARRLGGDAQRLPMAVPGGPSTTSSTTWSWGSRRPWSARPAATPPRSSTRCPRPRRRSCRGSRSSTSTATTCRRPSTAWRSSAPPARGRCPGSRWRSRTRSGG